MANELQTKLDAILNDKNTNLLPEHLKAGVTCLGVRGNFEGNGGSSDAPVKLFETIEEMHASENNEIGDLALVYRNNMNNATVDSQFDKATFPKTVVLPSAITDEFVNIMCRDAISGYRYYGELTTSGFDFQGYNELGEIYITYDSSDGITYTRTDDADETINFGSDIHFEYVEEWNDAVGYFIQIGGMVFDGLYKCSMLTDSRIVIPKLINTNFDAENKRFNVTINESDTIIDTEKLKPIIQKIIQDDNVTGLSYMHLLERSDGIYLGYTTHTNSSGTRYYDYANGVGVTSDGDILNYILGNAWYATGAQNIQYYLFKVDLETMSYNRISIIDAELKHWSSNYTAWFSMDDVVSIPMYISVSSGDVYLGNFRYETTEVVSAYSLTISNANNLKYAYKGYALAPTQLSATSDYVYDTEFYGKNGVETGKLATSVSTTWTDATTKLYKDIELLYENMDPIKITSSSELDSDMYIIPRKLDGTPLLDTSELTSAGRLFSGYDNLIYIPLLEFSNVATMQEMCMGSSNLKGIAKLNTSKVTTMLSAFDGCTNLTDVPEFNTSSCTTLQAAFASCPNLSDESLNNILAMCINSAVTDAKYKYLAHDAFENICGLGLSSSQATRCKTLSNYSAFTAAGWTTGY